ncbi:NAD-dependent deacetylase [Paraburkholderia sp. UCT31]|uniref:SIR2 family NAD-dependent protein deacylase n=1 Tax=Paraburkholderia sp. UCT31 TaxID=2615209 RepID=UPI0016556CE2|nr:Sir2 family NAD-dependent protein deacetylase [Paraburkholderia sp. UCT31]MBC8737163.1 NAD-dependent deacetylase [Paraburkholderia sp. UCT31]
MSAPSLSSFNAPKTPPRLYVFSGAGLSAESGISTFRTGDGIWTKAKIGEVCDFNTWRRNRDAVFSFYNGLVEHKLDAKPNAAHRILAKWQEMWGADRVRLLTQNVDDLLEQAGATDVVHLHGDMHSLLCTDCDHRFPKNNEYYDPAAACPTCGQVEPVKPGVVFFNESAPNYRFLQHMRRDLTEDDIVIAVGTSFEVLSPVDLLPPPRWNDVDRNMLVDPAPTGTEFFGVVEAHPATIGLRNLHERVMDLMGDSPDSPLWRELRRAQER